MNTGMAIGIGFIVAALLLFCMLWNDHRKEKHIDRHGTSGHMGATILVALVAVGCLLIGLLVCFVSLLVHIF